MTSNKNILRPLWEHIPNSLRQLPRWVVWRAINGKKVPHACRGAMNRVDPTDLSSGSAFAEARAAYDKGGFSGVGVLLGDNAIVAADLDHCVNQGKADERAIAVLRELGSTYVELSPSGSGLRAFGTTAKVLPGRRGEIDGVVVELYGDKRFMTVTGHVQEAIGTGVIGVLDGYAQIHERLRRSSAHRSAPAAVNRGMRDAQEVTVEAEGRVVTIPGKCVPFGTGMRNMCLFELARFVRGQFPSTALDDCYDIVSDWHEQVVGIIGTKDLGTSWADFCNSWDNVKKGHGTVLSELLSAPLPELHDWMHDHKFGPRGERLLKICLVLARHWAPEPFPADCRSVARYVPSSHTDVNSLLNAFVKQGYLERVEKGRRGCASTYRVPAERRSTT